MENLSLKEIKKITAVNIIVRKNLIETLDKFLGVWCEITQDSVSKYREKCHIYHNYFLKRGEMKFYMNDIDDDNRCYPINVELIDTFKLSHIVGNLDLRLTEYFTEIETETNDINGETEMLENVIKKLK